MRHTLLSLISIALLVCLSFTDGMSQRCKNTLANPQATSGTRGWQTHQDAGAAAQRFVVKTSNSHLHQDVKIPAGSRTAYFGGWTKNTKKVSTGHGYLYGYIMDANDKILEYVQLGVQNETTQWKYQSKTVKLERNATKVRFFLKKSAKRGVADQGNKPQFDNLILSFNCERKTTHPAKKGCRNTLKNHNASQDKQHWTFQSTANVTRVDGQKAFMIKESGSHIYQDVKVPAGTRYAYFGGWTKNSKKSETGQAYLYGYVFDASDKIIEYVQLGVINASTNWGYQDKTVPLTNKAKKIRFFLMRSNINGVVDANNIAYFDNLSLSFDCRKKTSKPRSTASACRNHIKHAQAGQPSKFWKTHKSAGIARGVFMVKKADSHMYQDINIPAKSRFVYFAGYTKNTKAVRTGHAYLYAYIMDANDKILEYVQFGTPHSGTDWKLVQKRMSLTPAAKKVRFFLKKSSKKDVPDSPSIAVFDNVKVSFNCNKAPRSPR